MDGKDSPLIGRLARALAPFDDDALAAVANRGLVRRARKDVEKSPPVVQGEAGDRLRLGVEGCSVDLAEAPAASRCTCAAGICRHILAAIMFVRAAGSASTSPSSTAAPPSADAAAAPSGPTEPSPPGSVPGAAAAESELLSIDDARLQSWAGKLAYRKGVHLASRAPAQFEAGPSLIIRFASQNITCRWIPGASLEGMLCTCHKPGPCEHKVAAVLALQVARAGRSLDTSQAVREASSGAARTRPEVCLSVRQVLVEMLTLGFSRLSLATEQRLRTLAVSAHGVDLPRLERLIKTLADEVALLLKRDAQAATAGLLIACARIEALCVALASPTPQLVGEHRSRYEPVSGDIELIGLGARRWRSRSGYVGLTAYFWDARAAAFASWCDARPVNTPGFDPAMRYTFGGPWSGCADPKSACQSTFRVLGSWRNAAGRISGRGSTRAIRLGAAVLDRVPAVALWSDLNSKIDLVFGGGMAQRSERDQLVLLAPTSVSPAAFDPVRQEASALLIDRAGKPLLLRLKHLADTPDAITTLQRIDPAHVHHVLGMLHVDAQGLFVDPITIYTAERLVNLTLDALSQAYPAAAPPLSRESTPAAPSSPSAPDAEESDDEAESEDLSSAEPDESDDPIAVASPVGDLLGTFVRELEALAESGIGVFKDLSPLRNLAAHFSSLGLDTLAAAARDLLDALEGYRKSLDRDASAVVQALLRASYLARLAQENQVAALAARALG